MTYKKAYMTIDATGKRYGGVYDTSNRRFIFQNDFIDICNKERDELNKKIDGLEKDLKFINSEKMSVIKELESLKKNLNKDQNSCRETKKKMRKIIEDRLGLFAMNNGTAFLDSPTCQMIMDSVINDMKKEDLWIDD